MTHNLRLFYTNIFIFTISTLFTVNIFSQNVFIGKNEDPINYCDFCLCSQGISPLDFSGKGIRIDQRYLLIDKLVNNNSTVTNNIGSFERHLTFQFSGIYSMSPRVSFLGILPYSVRSGRDDFSESIARTNGFGDLILFGRYFPVEKHTMRSTFLLSTQFGIKFPTGKANEKDPDGELIDPHLQLGTGSTDLLAGTNIMYSFKKMYITNNLLFGLRNKGNNGYRFGNTLNYDINFGYRIYQSGIGQNIVVLHGGFQGELHGKESQDGVIIDNSGGNTIFANAGINYFMSPKIELEFQFNLPVHYALNGLQDAETYRFSSGIQFVF